MISFLPALGISQRDVWMRILGASIVVALLSAQYVDVGSTRMGYSLGDAFAPRHNDVGAPSLIKDPSPIVATLKSNPQYNKSFNREGRPSTPRVLRKKERNNVSGGIVAAGHDEEGNVANNGRGKNTQTLAPTVTPTLAPTTAAPSESPSESPTRTFAPTLEPTLAPATTMSPTDSFEDDEDDQEDQVAVIPQIGANQIQTGQSNLNTYTTTPWNALRGVGILLFVMTAALYTLLFVLSRKRRKRKRLEQQKLATKSTSIEQEEEESVELVEPANPEEPKETQSPEEPAPANLTYEIENDAGQIETRECEPCYFL